MRSRGQGTLPPRRGPHQIEFSDELYGALEEFASRTQSTPTGSARLLVERGLRAGTAVPGADGPGSLDQQLKTLGCSTLATLMAVEQTQMLLISMLPDGAQRADELWDEAASSARARLIRIEEALTEETT